MIEASSLGVVLSLITFKPDIEIIGALVSLGVVLSLITFKHQA